MQTESPAPPSSSRLHLRLTVRALILVVLVFGVGLGWVVHRARAQRNAVAIIERAGGQVWYDWQVMRTPGPIVDNWVPNPKGRPAWPAWLVNALGIDVFSSVTMVDLAIKDRGKAMLALGSLQRLECIKMRIREPAPSGTPRAHMPRPESLTDADLRPLRDLKHLTYLGELGSTQITGAGLRHLAGLPELQALGLQSDSVTDDDLAVLEGMHNLRYLRIVGKLFPAGTPRPSQPKITARGLAHIERLTNLRRLWLGPLSITSDGLEHLRSLTRLQELTLLEAEVHDVTRIAGLTQLTELQISSASLDDDALAAIANLIHLKTLNLFQSNVTDAGLKHLRSLSKLDRLALSQSRVTDAGLAELAALPNLRTLLLANTAVSDEGLKVLATFPRLRRVSVGQTRVTPAGIAEFRKVNSRVRVSQ